MLRDTKLDLYTAGDGNWYKSSLGMYLTQANPSDFVNPYRFAGGDPVSRESLTNYVNRKNFKHFSGSELDAYGTGFWAGKNRLFGEGVRGILGDEYLLNASTTELGLLTVGVVTAGVLSGGLAFGAASAAGVGTLGAGAIAGAVSGGVEYAGWVAGSNLGSTIGGRSDGASFDAGQFGSHVVFGGAFGFGGSLAGKGIAAGARQLARGANNVSQAVRNATGRIDVAPKSVADDLASSFRICR
jgi:hypothetical protein